MRDIFKEAAAHGWGVVGLLELDRPGLDGTFQTMKYLNRLSEMGIGYSPKPRIVLSAA